MNPSKCTKVAYIKSTMMKWEEIEHITTDFLICTGNSNPKGQNPTTNQAESIQQLLY